MVLFLFVVMLLNLGGGESGFALDLVRRRAPPLALAVAAALAVLTFVGVLGADEVHAAGEAIAPPATFEDLARLLFGRFLLPFEIVSMLLLAAAIAVIVLAKRERGPAGQAPQGGDA